MKIIFKVFQTSRFHHELKIASKSENYSIREDEKKKKLEGKTKKPQTKKTLKKLYNTSICRKHVFKYFQKSCTAFCEKQASDGRTFDGRTFYAPYGKWKSH